MEQKMRFWLVLGLLAVLKKRFGADYEQLLKMFSVFSVFLGAKKIFKILLRI
jgi:hypothetical protein